MVLTKQQAIDIATEIFNGPRAMEKRRLDRITRALQPRNPFTDDPVRPSYASRGIYPVDDIGVSIPQDAPPVMRALARKARTNYLALVVDDFAESLFVEGYKGSQQAENARPWSTWQANGLDARQGGIHRHALAYGVAYAVVLPGDPKPVVRGKSPRTLTALYANPADDDWPEYALQVDQNSWTLYDDEAVYLIDENQQNVEPSLHELGVCPVVRYRDRMLLEGDPMGVIEPLIPIQSRIDETTFGLLVAQYYAAFKQRAIIGWVPQTEEEMLEASVSNIWTFADPDVKPWEFSESDLSKYIESGDSARRDLAAISQLPLHNFAVGSAIANISAEALAAMEASKERRGEEYKASLGESHEQMLRLSALADGDTSSANDFEAQVRWRDVTARSLAQTADALGKLATLLDIPARGLWSKVPGVSDQDLAEWQRLADEEAAEPGENAEPGEAPEPPTSGMGPMPMPPAA